MMHALDEEAAVGRRSDRCRHAGGNKAAITPSQTLLLAVLSAVIVLSHNFLFDGLRRYLPPRAGDELDASQRRLANELRGTYAFATPKAGIEGKRQLQLLDQRVMAVTKETWPKCVDLRMTGVQCKRFIDEEILTYFTGDDKLIRTIIIGKRNKGDEWYNSVVILMDDANLVKGRDGDGQVYYDFEWESSGTEATVEQQKEIPPVIATETEAGSPLADPAVLGPVADPESPEFEPLIIEDEPILVEGATVEGALLPAPETDTNPIGGGVVIDPESPNESPEADAKLETAITEAQSATVESGGSRTLPSFDCEGLSGYNCCLLIKATVKDSDIYGKAIQCHLNYVEESAKSKYFLNHRGKKVHIYTNHNELVSKVPKIVGSWPGGASDLPGWVEDGGEQII